MERSDFYMAEQQINVADKETLDLINSKIDTLDTVADNIYAKVDTEVAAIKTKTDLIGVTGDTGATATAGTVMGKLNSLLLSSGTDYSADISAIKSATAANNTASKTGTLS
jgi:hypothetical protein